MADNFEVTAGTGTVMPADDIGAGVLAQNVKLLDGTGAATAPIAADIGASANALRVAPANDITDGTYIGTVKVSATTAIVPGTAATNLGKAEDGAHTSGDVGVMALSVRQDAAAALAGTDADYQPLITDAAGKLWTAGTQVEDAAHTSGDKGVFALAVRSDSAAVTGGTDADYSGLIVDANGKLWTNAQVTAVVPGTAATSLGKAEDAAHTTGDVGVMALSVRQDTAAATAGTDADYQPLITDANGRLHTASVAVGTLADDAAASTTPPLILGAVAVETDGTDPTSVGTEADVARLRATRDRILLVSETHPYLWSAWDEGNAAEGPTEVKAAPGANLSLYVTDVIISNGATAGTFIIVEDTGGAGTQRTGTLYLGVNGHQELHLKTPIRVPVNKNVGYTCVGVTTHSITLLGYTAP